MKCLMMWDSQGAQWELAHLPVQEIWEARVQSLGGEDSLEEGMAAHCSILAGESHGWRRLVGYTVCRVPESWTQQSTHAHTQNVS